MGAVENFQLKCFILLGYFSRNQSYVLLDRLRNSVRRRLRSVALLGSFGPRLEVEIANSDSQCTRRAHEKSRAHTSCRRRERLNTIFADAIEPDEAVLNLHFDSNVARPVFVITESFAT